MLIPAFGITIPLITGMMRVDTMHPYTIFSAFLYTILIAFVIWQGNRYFLFTLRDYFDWFNKPVKRIVALLIAISFYTVPVSLLLHIGWYHIFYQGQVNWSIIYLSTSIILICVIFIAHTYETVFLVKETESEKIRGEQLQRAKTEAELKALNSQIDPHFLFNSLNTLSYLIETTPAKALEFNQNLADVYRYILRNRTNDLVALHEELEFAKTYFALIEKRFGTAVSLQITNHLSAENGFIPPISLQTLIENAVKHNSFTDLHPLQITITCDRQLVTVQNNIRLRNESRISEKTGLTNLRERCRLILGKEIDVSETENYFTVAVPVLN